jgi:hypothetical protein
MARAASYSLSPCRRRFQRADVLGIESFCPRFAIRLNLCHGIGQCALPAITRPNRRAPPSLQCCRRSVTSATMRRNTRMLDVAQQTTEALRSHEIGTQRPTLPGHATAALANCSKMRRNIRAFANATESVTTKNAKFNVVPSPWHGPRLEPEPVFSLRPAK